MLDFPRNSSKDRFNACTYSDDIKIVEEAFNIRFSSCYKQFLQECDGGMITEYDASYYIDMTDDEPDGPRYSSFNFFELEEVYELYDQLRLDDWMMQEGYECVYPIIPIGRTPQQKLLFILNRSGRLGESPVFMSLDFEGFAGCVQVAKDFDTFLGLYIDKEGFPPIDENSSPTSCKVCMAAYRLLEERDGKKSPEEQVVQYSALIKLYREDGWHYCMRGIANLDLNLREAALADFNRAIQRNDHKAFFYYCRGDLLLDHGSPRKALIDLDKAALLEPGDPLYISGRANAFFKLKKYKKALADCNEVLALNPKYEIALMTRIDVYMEIGEEDKADADARTVDNIRDDK